MVLQINRHDTTLMGSEEDLERMRIEFDEKHCVTFPMLLEPGLLESVIDGVDQAEFTVTKYTNMMAKDVHIKQDYPTSYLLNFLINSQTMFDTVQRITGCGKIGMFQGRVYRMLPVSDHYDTWHDDLVFNRMIAMSINLTRKSYSGGTVQFRERESEKIINEVHNNRLGDAMIFRLAPFLQHRVTPIKGSIPRTAFAGWFESAPDYRSWLESEQSSIKKIG